MREDEFRLVSDVPTFLANDVRKSVHELHLRDELEEGQVEVTTEARLQIHVCLCEQILLVLLHRQVKGRGHTCHEVRAVVVETLCRKLDVNGHGDVRRFDVLELLVAVQLIAEREVLRAEVHGGDNAQAQILGQKELAQDTHREARLIVRYLGKPLVAILVDKAILLQLDVLQMQACQESVVELALVNIGTVHHLPLLCMSHARRGGEKHHQCPQTPYYIIMCIFHHFIKRENRRFILQKAEFAVTLCPNFAAKLHKIEQLNTKNMRLTVIGAGNMGGALIKGWAKSGKIDNITVADKNEALLAQFKQDYPALNITTDNVEAVKGADIVVLVVKPWLMKMVLAEVKHALDLDKQIIVSDAANFTTGMLAEELGADGQFFYVIPNIAAEFGASMSFIAKAPAATDESLKAVEELYAIDGDTLVVAENLVGPGMMMASCGIAYVMRYIRAQMEGGCEMGFYPQQAKQIALQTMQGAVSLLKATGWHPEEAIDKVTTPGGVTIKGLNELDHAGFNSAVIRSLKAGLK